MSVWGEEVATEICLDDTRDSPSRLVGFIIDYLQPLPEFIENHPKFVRFLTNLALMNPTTEAVVKIYKSGWTYWTFMAAFPT